MVRSLEKHRSNSFYLASVFYSCGISAYIIAPEHLKPGHFIMAGAGAPPSLGSTLFLKNIPFNIKIHNIESSPRSGGKYIRSAGN
jgi:large subunit ribosomal protein L2